MKKAEVFILGLVPRGGYVNAMVRNVNNRLPDYCSNRYVNHCNMSGLHLTSKRVSLFDENYLMKNLLNTLDS